VEVVQGALCDVEQALGCQSPGTQAGFDHPSGSLGSIKSIFQPTGRPGMQHGRRVCPESGPTQLLPLWHRRSVRLSKIIARSFQPGRTFLDYWQAAEVLRHVLRRKITYKTPTLCSFRLLEFGVRWCDYSRNGGKIEFTAYLHPCYNFQSTNLKGDSHEEKSLDPRPCHPHRFIAGV